MPKTLAELHPKRTGPLLGARSVFRYKHSGVVSAFAEKRLITEGVRLGEAGR